MTVIAYRDGVLAGDSQEATERGLILGAAQKLFRAQDGTVFGCCGVALDCRMFGQWLEDGAEGPFKAEWPDDFRALVVRPDGSVWRHEGRGMLDTTPDATAAIGAGAEIAIGAMAAGASAIGAVEIAIKRSVWCGGPVQVLSIRLADRRAALEDVPSFLRAGLPEPMVEGYYGCD